MTAFAYLVPLPRSGRRDLSTASRRQVANNAPQQSVPSAKPTGVEPGERTIRGFYRGAFADVLADQLEELAAASSKGLERIPVFATDAIEGLSDGYYTVGSATTGPYEEQAAGKLHEYTLSLESVGTRRTHFRAVACDIVTEDNDFGSGAEEPYVGIDARAREGTVRWFDAASETLEAASPVATVTGEFGDVDLYDASTPSFDSPRLIYDLPYADEGDVDVVVWDDRGKSAKTDADGVVQWQRVFSSGHGFAGSLVLSNRRVRLTVDDIAGTIAAEAYTSGSWSDVALGTSDWVPIDIDVVTIGPAAARVQLLFENTSTGATFPLDAFLYRGWTGVLFARTENHTGATPSGLIDLLSPIASDRLESPGPTATLVERSDVRR